MKKGIDVSRWQGVINWDAVKAAGVEFVIIRAGYGNDEPYQDDPQFERNYSECKRLNIPCGIYLYSYATSKADAQSEAAHALRLMKNKTFELPCFYDLEDKTVAALGNGNILEIAKTFCEIVGAVVPAGIYANKYWRLNKLTDEFYNTVPFWLAHYTSETDYNGNKYAWQYSDSGHVNGINGAVDMNYLYGDFINSKPAAAEQEEEKPAQSEQPKAAEHAHKVGEDVIFSTCYSSSTAPNNEAIPADRMKVNHGVITKIVDAKNPYLLNNGLCWVNDGDIRGLYTGATNNAPAAAEPKIYKAGDAINLNNAALYANATSDKATKRISGTYFIYDGKLTNGRCRITNNKANVNKKPVGLYVTGWIKL